MQTPNEHNTTSIRSSLIILICISFNVLHTSQGPCCISPNYVKAPGQSNDVVIRPNSLFDHERCNNDLTNNWLSSIEDNEKWFFIQKSNDMVNKVLSCVENNNKLFVCYAGYRETLKWRCNAGYRTNPVQKKTNRLTEIDLATKIEIEFSTPPEIDNEYPVIDIAQWKNNYYVAHNNSVNIYQSVANNKLMLQHQFFYHICNGDIIKKIFLDFNNNLIAISQNGDIFHHPITASTSASNTTTIAPLIQSATKEQTIHSFAYNTQKNLLLLGCTGSVEAIVLNSDGPLACSITVAPNLSIHTIDTYDNNILFSRVIQNPDLGVLQYHNGHSKEKYCCKEKATPTSQWKDCADCIAAEQKWSSDKETWKNTPINITNQTPKQLARLTYDTPQPKPCSHRTCPDNEKNLPDSCRDITILLIQCDDLLKKISASSSSCTIASLNAQSLQILIKTYDTLDPDPATITHTFLDNHFLFIGRFVSNTSDIYKFPLQSLDADKITSMLNDPVSFTKHNDDKQYIRFVPDNNPLLYNGAENKHKCPIMVNRNLQNPDDIIVIKKASTCPFGHQGECNDLRIYKERDHFFQWVYDTIVYSTNSKPANMIENMVENKTISIKRWWVDFSIKKRLSSLVGLVAPIVGGLICLYALALYVDKQDQANLIE